jgi:hypothetical protein
MGADELDAILTRVATGALSPDEAEPLVRQLTSAPSSPPPVPPPPASAPRDIAGGAGPVRAVRLRVREGGRDVVDLRVPMALATLSDGAIPGLSGSHLARLRSAIRTGDRSTILDVRDERGDGVTVTTE